MGVVMLAGIVPKLTAPSVFPGAPSAFELIDIYRETTTIEAPEDGWFQLELCGSSGAGGQSNENYWKYSNDHYEYRARTGGGGGGGAVGISRVQLHAGDKIHYTHGAVGENNTVTIESTVDGDVYEQLIVTSGANGTDGIIDKVEGIYKVGVGGAGGTASGGNYTNYNGGTGGNGSSGSTDTDDYDSEWEAEEALNVAGGVGGRAGNTNGNAGGKGESVTNGGCPNDNGTGLAGFLRLYRGNTNLG